MTDSIAALTKLGYHRIAETDGITAGSRVRHLAEQYPTAHTTGTATVIGVYERTPSSWTQSHGVRDVEIVVTRDDGREARWADYHTRGIA